MVARPHAWALLGRPMPRHRNRRAANAIGGCLLVALLAGCGGLSAPAPPAAPRESPEAATPLPPTVSLPPTTPRRPCTEGRLVIGDLIAIDAEWVRGVTDAVERAAAWQDDAQLVQLGVACRVLEPSFRWQGLFYSAAEQSFFLSDTGETEPAEVESASVPSLPTGGLSFVGFQRALARAGFADDTEISAAGGIEIRLNVESDPFGPPNAPKGVVYYHVALTSQGEVLDVFVDADAWVVYRY